jgi:hypothetical protein
MSFFSEASLAMIPSGYKTSKVYSAIPTSGDGDLTFSRSNDTATRVGPDGLIEKVRTNLVTYSNTFSNADWLVDQVTKTTGQTDPNGGTTAVLLTSTNTSSTYMYQTKAGLGCLSIYAKVGTRSTFSLIPTGYNNGAFFDLSSVTATASGIGSLAKIESVGGGWFRCSVATSSSTDFIVSLSNIAGTDSVISDTMTFAFAQGETGDIATPYIATTSAAVSVGPVANVPRLDYLDSSSPRLLLEPQRTNLANWSEQADQYTKVGATIGSNVLTSPDGYTNADSIIEDGSTGLHTFYNFGLTTFTAAAYTASVFAKKGGRDWFSIQLYDGTQGFVAFFNLDTGVVGNVDAGATATITNYGNGWYRCTVTATTAAGSSGGIAIFSASANGSTNYAGTNGLAAGYFYGWQLELASYATSYIPTLGAAVTRGADAASKTGISSLIGQTEGTVYFEIQLPNEAAEGGRVLMQIGASPDRIYFAKDSNSQNIFQLATQSSSGYNFVNTSNVTAGTVKMAIAYKSGQNAFYLNGTLISTTSDEANPASMSQIIFGDPVFGNSQTIVNQALLFKTRLSNADLAALTA